MVLGPLLLLVPRALGWTEYHSSVSSMGPKLVLEPLLLAPTSFQQGPHQCVPWSQSGAKKKGRPRYSTRHYLAIYCNLYCLVQNIWKIERMYIKVFTHRIYGSKQSTNFLQGQRQPEGITFLISLADQQTK